MGWEDRPYFRDRGASSNPLTALLSGSVPLFTAFGIRVRAHSALILFILCAWLFIWTEGYDWPNKLVSMGMLFGIVLLHEFGHCLAARMVGGSSDEILLWPLGGLAFPDAPQRPGARFGIALGGPFVNVAICGISALFAWHLAAPVGLNLFHPLPHGLSWHKAAFYLHWSFIISFGMLLLNMLPVIPLDGGQIIQAFLWKLIGYSRSRMVSSLIGLCASAALGISSLILWSNATFFLLFLAACLFFANYRERLILREAGPSEPWQSDEPDFAASLYREPATRRRRTSKRAQRLARKNAMQVAAERQRLDAILAKVSSQGLSSLTWRERRTLRIATEKRRQHELELKGMLDK